MPEKFTSPFPEHHAWGRYANGLAEETRNFRRRSDFSSWGSSPPSEGIIIGSGSNRKAFGFLLLAYLYQEFSKNIRRHFVPAHVVPGLTDIRDLPAWFRTTIPNQDNAIPVGARISLGMYDNIPLMVRPSKGPVEENVNVLAEATAKGMALRTDEMADSRNLGRRHVFYVGTDTHQYFEGRYRGVVGQHGKPVHDAGFDSRRHFYNEDGSPNAALLEFGKQYISANYPHDEILVHEVGSFYTQRSVAANGQIIEETATDVIQSRYQVPPNIVDYAPRLDIGAGGGGLNQLFFQESPAFKQLSTFDQMVAIFQIMGIPFYQMMAFMQRMSRKDGERY